MSSFYGHVALKRYGKWGSICGANWTDAEANVVCRQLGFPAGYNTYANSGSSLPPLLGSIKCHGNETDLHQCSYPDFIRDAGCPRTKAVAAVICSKTNGKYCTVTDQSEYWDWKKKIRTKLLKIFKQYSLHLKSVQTKQNTNVHLFNGMDGLYTDARNRDI